MPFKDKKYQLKYRREWYAKNKESEKAHVRRRKLELREWLKNYKKGLSCSKCGENHIATLEFHHEKGNKEKSVANMIHDGHSVKMILNEIEKCVVLCSNCHRKIHYAKKIEKL